MSRYLRTAPEYRELGALTTEDKALATVAAVGLATSVIKWTIIGFVGYKLIKAVAK